MPCLYINIHSHTPAGAGEWTIQNLYTRFEETVEQGYYSMGLHPWHIQPGTAGSELNELKKYSRKENVLAIGECGLDRICETPIQFQEEVFIQQLLWANEINKPLILHCVRAHDALLRLLKKHGNRVPVIFHGFHNGFPLAQKIMEAGHRISFGKALQQKNMQEVFKQCNLSGIFLETDDAGIRIQDQYTLAAGLKNISEEQLSLQLKQNVQTVFNTEII